MKLIRISLIAVSLVLVLASQGLAQASVKLDVKCNDESLRYQLNNYMYDELQCLDGA